MLKELYYPSFEVGDPNWLKYALLYKQNLTTIIPNGLEIHTSDAYRYIWGNTDLLEKYSPTTSDKNKAHNIFFPIIKSIVSNQHDYLVTEPLSYSQLSRDKSTTLYSVYKNSDFNYTLYDQKMSSIALEYLIDNGLAVRGQAAGETNLSRRLAYFYMNTFATVISKHGFIPTSDVSVDNYLMATMKDLNYFDKIKKHIKTETTHQLLISQFLPKNIHDYTFLEIIRLREKRSYADALDNYNKVINEIISINHSEEDIKTYLRTIDECTNEIKCLIKRDLGPVLFVTAKATIDSSIESSQLNNVISSLVSYAAGNFVTKITKKNKISTNFKERADTRKIITNLKYLE